MSQRKQKDVRVLEQLKRFFRESQRTYGVRRLTDDLKDAGEDVNHKRVARLKRENGIYPKQYKAYVVTTDSSHGRAVSDNILNRQFTVGAPNAVWVSDITYIGTAAGWVYLAVIIDLYSRKVIGWHVAEHMRAELVCEALVQARARRGCLPTLFHSDQGVQYVSDALEERLKGVTVSMSRKGNCWDNAVAESFFGTLKAELVDHESYKNIHEARMSLFQYIEGFYNRRRRHSHLGNIAPEVFEVNAA
jgi:putative transposase